MTTEAVIHSQVLFDSSNLHHLWSKLGRKGSHLEVSSWTFGDGAGGGGVSVLPPAGLPGSCGSHSMVAATVIKGCSGSDKQVCCKFANSYLRHIRIVTSVSTAYDFNCYCYLVAHRERTGLRTGLRVEMISRFGVSTRNNSSNTP